jgi:RHS repeat-associated protein
VASVVDTFGSALTYTYDPAGRRATMQGPGGRTTYSYDPAGNNTQLVDPRGKITSYTFDGNNRQVFKELANGLSVTHVYDPAGWLTLVQNVRSDGSPQSVFTYTYDNVGNRTTEEALDGTRTTWSYDSSYQLKREQRDGSLGLGNGFDFSYAYDNAGNRLTEIDHATGDVTTSAYDAANQLSHSDSPAGRTSFTYDADGNQLRKETPSELTDYAWDETGKMTLAQPPAGDVSFAYNAQGQRVEKETPAEVRRFLYDFQRLYQERDADDDPLREYTFGPDNYEENPAGYGDLISEYDFDDDETYAHAYDAQWCTEALLDDAQSQQAAYRYRAFGLVALQQGPAETKLSFVGKHGYYWDEELSLYALGIGNPASGGRFLRPDTAQFTSKDPAQDDPNEYRYARNNPINVIDPSGEQPPFDNQYARIAELIDRENETYRRLQQESDLYVLTNEFEELRKNAPSTAFDLGVTRIPLCRGAPI